MHLSDITESFLSSQSTDEDMRAALYRTKDGEYVLKVYSENLAFLKRVKGFIEHHQGIPD